MSMQVDGRVAKLPHGNLRAIARSTLLRVLQASAEQAGVRLHFGARCDVRAIDADLMVAADGVGGGDAIAPAIALRQADDLARALAHCAARRRPAGAPLPDAA